jgi:hypothetical protein
MKLLRLRYFVAVCGTEVTPVAEFFYTPCAAPLKLGYLMSSFLHPQLSGNIGENC